MDNFRAECCVMEEEHIFFMVDHRVIAIEPHLMADSDYVCIEAEQARRLAAWLNGAADHLDARAAKRQPA